MKNLLFFSIFHLIVFNQILSQELTRDNFTEQIYEMFHDAGLNWESITAFNPRSFDPDFNVDINLDSKNKSNGQLNLNVYNQNLLLGGYGYLTFKDHYYCYLSQRIPVQEKEEINLHPKNPNLHKQYFSGLGYQNNWVRIQIARGRESWGSGNSIHLGLKNSSEPYDYFLLGSDYGIVRVRYIHGFLENIGENINRYITARGIELTNKKSLVIGFSETVIYSGENRSLDIGYFNPISSHTEIEMNDRLNNIGGSNSNAIWQLHVDHLLKKNLRFSFNYLIDEFVLDPDIEKNKENGTGFSIRLAYTPIFKNNKQLTFYSSFIQVGTPTFRHNNGANNFVQNGRPLGWEMGSDGREIEFGINFLYKHNLKISTEVGISQIGEETINERVFDPYKDYLKGSFPSGENDFFHFATISIHHLYMEKYSIFSNLSILDKTNYFELIISASLGSFIKK